jgi:hypothetical protein
VRTNVILAINNNKDIERTGRTVPHNGGRARSASMVELERRGSVGLDDLTCKKVCVSSFIDVTLVLKEV